MKSSITAPRSELPLLASLIPALAIDPELFRPLVKSQHNGQMTLENLAEERTTVEYAVTVTE